MTIGSGRLCGGSGGGGAPVTRGSDWVGQSGIKAVTDTVIWIYSPASMWVFLRER